jgi:hypothetical protein
VESKTGTKRTLVFDSSFILVVLFDFANSASRATEQFRLAEAEGKLLRLPTDDGAAVVLRTHPEGVLCPVEISMTLKSHPNSSARGIHSGPVQQITN